MRFLVTYTSTAIVFCVLDFVWLGLVATTFYKSQLGALLLAKPNMLPALVFYVVYVAGLVVFCVMPAIDAQSWSKAAWMGALFGLCAYATYDLSNLATLKDWSTAVTVVDMAWGSVVTALSATGGYFGSQLINRWLA